MSAGEEGQKKLIELPALERLVQLRLAGGKSIEVPNQAFGALY
jgi:hypothetical protein